MTTTTTPTADSIIAEVLKLKPASNSNTPAMLSTLEEVAAKLAEALPAKGLELRKGSYSRNSKNGEARLYILKAGAPSREALKTWSFTTQSGGYYRPVAPSKLREALVEILAYVEAA